MSNSQTSNNTLPPWLEPGLIILVIGGVAFAAGYLPTSLAWGTASCLAAGVLLGQGLLRDLGHLATAKTGTPSPARAICVESGLGVVLLLAGAILLFSAAGARVPIQPMGWVGFIGAILVLGYLLRNTVLDLKRWRFYQEPHHRNVVFRWR